jgi:hypothetical protein
MPYEFHPALTTPPNKTVLWRYMDFAKFLDLVESRTLWFTRIDKLEDPLEGTHTDAELEEIRKHVDGTRAQALTKLFRYAKRELFVNCWRSGPAESLAMWDLYGKGSGIVAVKSAVGRLKQVVATCGEPVYISKVKYVDWGEAPGLDNVLVACSRKDLSYQHESEVRVIIMGDFKKIGPKGRQGVHLTVDVQQLITEVMVGPREQKWVVRLAGRVMNRYGLPQIVVASNRLTPRR